MLDFLFKKKNNLTTDKSERLNKIYTCLKNKYPSDNISDDRKTELKNLITKYGYLPYPYIKALEELTNEEVLFGLEMKWEANGIFNSGKFSFKNDKVSVLARNNIKNS